MKWFTLICVLLCSIATESRHLHKRDADHQSLTIGTIYNQMGTINFNKIVLVMLAQNFQKCTFAEHLKEAAELTAFAEHCAAHEEEEECKKPMITIFHDKVCQFPEFAERYSWKDECCSKAEPERERCFHDHRDIKEEPYKRPEVEAVCAEHKEHPDHVFYHYVENVAKRHPDLYPPAVLEIARQYNHIVAECCSREEKAEKENCFDTKAPEVKKKTKYIEVKQKHTCHILSKFPERIYKALKLAYISRKHPAADYEVVHKLVLESVQLHKDCCKGDVVKCMVEKMEYTKHICDNQEKLSHDLKACCEKPLLERTPCIKALPKDEPPADLPQELTEFVEDDQVCKRFADHTEEHLAKFLYEFSRRHQTLSVQALLRVGKGYEALLTKCCNSDHPVECYKAAPQLLADGIRENQEILKHNCELYEQLGAYGYHISLLSRYTRKMPQVTDGTLLEITEKMTQFGGKCCALPEDQRMVCAEEKLDLLLGEMCEKQTLTPINEQVRHCCGDSYADRRPCFTKLGVDPSYEPPAFDENTFRVGADICEGTEESKKAKRLTLLIHVLKTKPDISKEKLKETVEEFTKIREKCCAAKDQQLCFNAERPAVLLHLKEALAH